MYVWRGEVPNFSSFIVDLIVYIVIGIHCTANMQQPLESDLEIESVSTLQVESEGSGDNQNSIDCAEALEIRVRSMLNWIIMLCGHVITEHLNLKVVSMNKVWVVLIVPLLV